MDKGVSPLLYCEQACETSCRMIANPFVSHLKTSVDCLDIPSTPGSLANFLIDMKPKFKEWVQSQGNVYFAEGLVGLYGNIQDQLDGEHDHLKETLERRFDGERRLLRDALEKSDKYNKTLKKQIAEASDRTLSSDGDKPRSEVLTEELSDVREELENARRRIRELEGLLVGAEEDNARLKQRNWELSEEQAHLIVNDKTNHDLYLRVQSEKVELNRRATEQSVQISRLQGELDELTSERHRLRRSSGHSYSGSGRWR